MVEFLERGGRLERPDVCPAHVFDVMLRCWEHKPSERITFQQLLDFFNGECSRIGQQVIASDASAGATYA